MATLHRPANVDDPLTAARLVAGLVRAAAILPIIMPLHPRGRAVLEEQGLGEVPNLQIVEPLGYLDFMSLLAGASVVLTDSGGIQEETTILRIPCLTMRPNTERPVTVELGTNRLVGSDPDLVEQGVLDALEPSRPVDVPPLWDGRAGQRIADVLAAV